MYRPNINSSINVYYFPLYFFQMQVLLSIFIHMNLFLVFNNCPPISMKGDEELL